MCLHVLRQLHRLLLVWGQMVNVMAITVVPVSLLLSYQYVLCVQCVSVCLYCVLCCGPVCVRSVCVGVLWPCVFVSVLWCVVVLCVCVRSVRVSLVCVCVCVCWFKTPPCVDQKTSPCVPVKRPCLMWHGRFAGTHGGVLNVHTEVFSEPRHTPHNTQHFFKCFLHEVSNSPTNEWACARALWHSG